MAADALVVHRTNGVALLEVSGEHDVHTAPALRARMAELIEERLPVVVDLTPTTFIDSVVLEALISAQRASRAAGLGFAVLIGPEPAEPAVRRIFELTRLMSVLPVCDDRRAALAAVLPESGRA